MKNKDLLSLEVFTNNAWQLAAELSCPDSMKRFGEK
jgi:hypothetical protein